MIRLGDKVVRLQAAARRAVLANLAEPFVSVDGTYAHGSLAQRIQEEIAKALPFESIADNLDDIAVYATIARVLYEEAEESKRPGVDRTIDAITEATIKRAFPVGWIDPTENEIYSPFIKAARRTYDVAFPVCPSCHHAETCCDDDCTVSIKHRDGCICSNDALPEADGAGYTLPKFGRLDPTFHFQENQGDCPTCGAEPIRFDPMCRVCGKRLGGCSECSDLPKHEAGTLYTVPKSDNTVISYQEVRAEFDKGPQLSMFEEKDDLATRAYRMAREAEAAE